MINDSQRDMADKEWLYSHEERAKEHNIIEDIAVVIAMALAVFAPFGLWYTGVL